MGAVPPENAAGDAAPEGAQDGSLVGLQLRGRLRAAPAPADIGPSPGAGAPGSTPSSSRGTFFRRQCAAGSMTVEHSFINSEC